MPLDKDLITELLELAAEHDEGLFAELCKSFEEDAPRLIDVIQSSKVEAQLEEIEGAAHALKSKAGSLGLSDLMNCAYAIMDKARDRRLSNHAPEIAEIKNIFSANYEELKQHLQTVGA